MTPSRQEGQQDVPRTAFLGDGVGRWNEVVRFLRAHGDHGLVRIEGDEEFGYHDGLACPVHEAQTEFIPPIEAAAGQREAALDIEGTWMEVPDYRGLLERLARLPKETHGLPSEIIAAYDAIANEARALLEANPDYLPTPPAGADK